MIFIFFNPLFKGMNNEKHGERVRETGEKRTKKAWRPTSFWGKRNHLQTKYRSRANRVRTERKGHPKMQMTRET
jgi:hypothetical protein